MLSYLDYIEPDYKLELLELSPNFEIVSPGPYKQVMNDTDGGSPFVVTLKSTPIVTSSLKFTGLKKANRDILISLYYDPLKAYGMARSYVWKHPQTDDLYTVQNVTALTETIKTYNRYDISFTVKILGTAADAFGAIFADDAFAAFADDSFTAFADDFTSGVI